MSLTVKQALTKGIERELERVDAEVLLCHVLNKTRSYLFAWPEAVLSHEQESLYLTFLERRQLGEPVAYLVGIREFWSLPIQTSPATLIPRPDTEVLVETVLEYFDSKPHQCVDLGTGTGAVALAIKSERPDWTVEAVDRVSAAVELAATNAQNLQLDIHCRLGSWLDDVVDRSLDIIVSNPPYIDADDEHLSQGDVRFEPSSALIADKNGLADIQKIITQAAKALRPGGAVFLEHGWQQADAVRELLEAAGFERVATRKDYGDNDRVSFGFQK